MSRRGRVCYFATNFVFKKCNIKEKRCVSLSWRKNYFLYNVASIIRIDLLIIFCGNYKLSKFIHVTNVRDATEAKRKSLKITNSRWIKNVQLFHHTSPVLHFIRKTLISVIVNKPIYIKSKNNLLSLHRKISTLPWTSCPCKEVFDQFHSARDTGK